MEHLRNGERAGVRGSGEYNARFLLALPLLLPLTPTLSPL